MLFSSSFPVSGFDKMGISFSIAPDWEISDERNLGEEGYTLTCEKTGMQNSGIFVLTWFEDSMDLDVLLSTYADQMSSDEVLQNGDFKSSSIANTQIGNYNTRSLTYTSEIIDESYQGEIHCFYGRKRTLILHLHEAIIDSSDNIASFSLLKRTLDCEGDFSP